MHHEKSIYSHSCGAEQAAIAELLDVINNKTTALSTGVQLVLWMVALPGNMAI